MKRAQFIAINKCVVAELPCFGFKGSLLVMEPIETLLRGIDLEGSAFGKTSFDAEMLVLPLCVPTTFLHFLFGDRVRSVKGAWDTSMPELEKDLAAAIRQQVLPYLQSMSTLDAFIAKVEAGHRSERTLEALAYAQVRVGAFRSAIATLDEIGRIDLDHGIAWQKELAERTAALRAQTLSDPTQAQADVIGIEAQTVRNLGLEKFWAGSQVRAVPAVGTS